jgi:hypothetical protein
MWHLAGISIVDFRTACVQVRALDVSKPYWQEDIQPAKIFGICKSCLCNRPWRPIGL